jgi:transcriptional regulator with XRE-family HTH domain
MPADTSQVGERVAFYRKRLGLSQIEFAGLIDRSESWVSQVERGVRAIDRLSVLQIVADKLNVSVAELRGEEDGAPEQLPEQHTHAFEALRLTLTGHPAPITVIAPASVNSQDASEIGSLRSDHASVWEMVHESRYSDLAPLLSKLITGLERAVRSTAPDASLTEARELLTDTYQAAAAALAKIGDMDAAWIAADRAAFVAESIGSPLTLAASLFRMAHVFLSLSRLPQAEKVALNAANALQVRIEAGATDSETLSLYGAFQLVLAVAAARENQRIEANKFLETARGLASQVGEGRNDFGTEFGPTNVALHAVSIAVELGDAGQAIELSQDVNPSNLSPERQARYLIDLALAHDMRRHIGEALRCLQAAEDLTPEQTRTHRVARDVARDLVQLSGAHLRAELRELAERFSVI